MRNDIYKCLKCIEQKPKWIIYNVNGDKLDWYFYLVVKNHPKKFRFCFTQFYDFFTILSTRLLFFLFFLDCLKSRFEQIIWGVKRMMLWHMVVTEIIWIVVCILFKPRAWINNHLHKNMVKKIIIIKKTMRNSIRSTS